MRTPRRIAHLDMDAFYASVEQLDHPELRGRPVLIGSTRPRGVVLTASYEARPFGCHSAQPMSVARRRCPEAVVVPPRGHRYREVSEQVFALMAETTPLVEPLSIDEAFLDLTGTERLLGPAEEVVRELRRRVLEQTGLTASVGLAPNKFLAKLASDLCKPDGLLVVTDENRQELLDPLPVERLWGVGPATAGHLHRLGLRRVRDLREFPVEVLEQRLGSAGRQLHRLSEGRDERPVVSDGDARSIGQEQTFEEDLQEPAEVREVLLAQVEQVGRRLRRHGLLARGVSVKIRYGDFQTITRSATLERPTDVTLELRAAATDLWDRWQRASFRPVRLIGVSATRFARQAGQLPLFGHERIQRQRNVDRALDALHERFGAAAIRRGPPPSRG